MLERVRRGENRVEVCMEGKGRVRGKINKRSVGRGDDCVTIL